MGQINTNNYPTVDSLADADLLIVENATNGTGTTTPKQLRENAIGTDTLQTSAQTVTGAINELKGEIDAGAGVVCYDVDTITSGYLGGQFSGSANLLLLHLTTDGTADATNGYMMMLSYTRPVARFAYGRLVDVDGVAYKQDVYADNTIICKISNSGEGTESDPEQVVILGIINAGFMLTPTAVVSDRDIQDGQGNTLSVLAEALTKTASGNPVVISDCAGGKARSLKTVINAIQDLHGYDHPWAGGAGKNKLPMTVASIKAANTGGTWSGNVYTINGGTITILTDSDGNVTGFKVNGTFNDAVNFYVTPTNMSLESNGMIYSGITSGSGSTYFLYFDGAGVEVQTSEVTITTGRNPITMARIVIRSGAVLNNVLFYPMVRPSTESDASFAPYSNICPISGRTAVAVDDVGKNVWNYGVASDNQFSSSHQIKGLRTFTVSAKTTGVGQINVCGYNSQGTKIYSDAALVTSGNTYGTKTITVTEDLWLCIYKITSSTVPSEVQVEEGDTSTAYEPYAHSSATIQLGTTVYGADINWDTGVMTVTDGIIDMGNMGWTYSSANTRFQANMPLDYKIPASSSERITGLMCSCYEPNISPITGSRIDGTISGYEGSLSIYVNDYSYTDVTQFKTARTGQKILYRLATPTTIQLTSEQLEMLKGYNRVSIDSGSIELGYIAKLT